MLYSAAPMNALARFLATLGPIGYAPVAPATAGSAAVVLVGWFLPAPALPVALAFLAVGTALAVWIAGTAERSLGHDAHPIVIDEVIGQSIALLLAPHVVWVYLAAFLLFRLFDIWKPLGAREIQRLPGGLGVVADDVIAGLASLAVLQGGLWLARANGLIA
jgi:phosphatidylglycerophosphatase A